MSWGSVTVTARVRPGRSGWPCTAGPGGRSRAPRRSIGRVRSAASLPPPYRDAVLAAIGHLHADALVPGRHGYRHEAAQGAVRRRLRMVRSRRLDQRPARLHLGIWENRPDLRDAFLRGYGRQLDDTDHAILQGCSVLTALWLLIKARETGQPSFEDASRAALQRLLAHDCDPLR